MPLPPKRVVRLPALPSRPTVAPVATASRPAPAKPLTRAIVTAPATLSRPSSGPVRRLAAVPGATMSEEQRQASVGFAAHREDQAKFTKLRDRRMARPFPFFLKAGESANIVILDVAPYLFHEHRWKGPDGKWNRSEVCLKNTGLPCPGCAKFGREGTWIMGMTIIDSRPYTAQKGTEAGVLKRFQRKFMGVKSSVIEKYERLYTQQGENLRGVCLQVFRSATNDKAPNTGDDFTYVKRLTEAEIAKYGKEATLTDYVKAYTPLTPEEFQYVLGAKGGKAAGAEDLANTEDDDEVPF